jgi:hypothetical protein
MTARNIVSRLTGVCILVSLSTFAGCSSEPASSDPANGDTAQTTDAVVQSTTTISQVVEPVSQDLREKAGLNLVRLYDIAADFGYGDYGPGEDLPVSGNCPMGFSGDWVLERVAVSCVESGSFDSGDVQLWIAAQNSKDITDGVSELLGIEYVDDYREQVVDGELSSMCIQHHTLGSTCAVVWDGGAVTVAYVCGYGANHTMESAGLKLRSQLATIVRGLAEWDPALSLGGS